MDNERRADLGAVAVWHPADQTGVASHGEPAGTAVVDVLAYILHFCDRLGLDPQATIDRALTTYNGDFEDGPPAAKVITDPTLALDDMDDLPLWIGRSFVS